MRHAGTSFPGTVPHVPRTHVRHEPGDTSSIARSRLLQRIRHYSLVEKQVAGDGNCQAR